MYENWEKDICNMINSVGVSADKVRLKKKKLRKNLRKIRIISYMNIPLRTYILMITITEHTIKFVNK
ncbi:hypothetical protein DFH70_002977 [Clostridium beijerinckii]|uniref:hypothetical protein n=1 Tax=Clostridium beijerinckii TaxID=1520 RepID=UPI0015713F58|nr:hypothetical protein [Clostridium beijerinckii]NRW23851.1 hypothetical protein [Clostridium beijerinckii]